MNRQGAGAPDHPPDGAATDKVVGRRVGHYDVLSLLGAGGMGRVYLATDTRLGRQVALKFLPEDLAADPKRAARFEREAHASSAINHPNIITIYDIGESESGRFIAMELVTGRTFRQLLDDTRPVATSARIVRDAARGLAAAHAAGVIHRDIKPANLMLREDGLVKVLDFGLARQVALEDQTTVTMTPTVTEHGTTPGTVRYMSPEQARAGELTPATDVFSLGIVLFQLITRRHPFHAESTLAALAAITSEPAPLPSQLSRDVPASLDDLVLSMLEKDARRRPTCDAVVAALDELASGRDETPGAVAPTTVPRRRTHGRDGERQILDAALVRLRHSHRPTLVLVGGDPGLGKTTLVEEFLDAVALTRPPVLIGRGRCSERLSGTSSYLPILEALETLTHGPSGSAVVRALQALAPTWYDQVSSVGPASGGRSGQVPAPSSPERLKREFVLALEGLGRQHPIILFLDDLQWADASTVDLLLYLRGRSDSLPVLILGTYRSSEIDLAERPFGEFKPDLMTRGPCDEISLGHLNEADIARYVAHEYPDHQFPDDFCALVYRRTDGHPLFMVDALRHLRDRRIIEQVEGRWRLSQPVAEIDAAIPPSMQQMIERKLGLLDDEQRRLLVAGSVQGEAFDVAVVATALELDPAEVEERLEPVERTFALVSTAEEHELPDGTLTARYRFVHGLYHQSLYGTLRPARRANLSGAVARALVALHGDKSSKIAAQLALLFDMAREFEQAARFYLTATRAANHVCAHTEAELLSSRALAAADRLPDDGDHARLALDLRLARVPSIGALRTHGASETIEIFEQARALCEQLGDTMALFGVKVGLLWSHLANGDMSAAQAFAAELLALAESIDNDGLRIESHFVSGVVASQRGQLAAACQDYEKVLSLYDPKQHAPLAMAFLSDPAVHGGCELGYRLHERGCFAEARRRSGEAIELGRQVNHPLSLSLALMMGQSVVLMAGRADLAKPWREEFAELQERHPNAHAIWAPYYEGWAVALDGAVADGLEMMQRTVARLEASGMRFSESAIRATIANTLLVVGRPEEALGEARALANRVEATGARHCLAELWRLQAAALLQSQGDTPSEVERLFHDAVTLAREQEAGYWELRAAVGYGRWLVNEGRRDEARVLVGDTCGRFDDEELEIPDLAEARALRATLSQAP